MGIRVDCDEQAYVELEGAQRDYTLKKPPSVETFSSLCYFYVSPQLRYFMRRFKYTAGKHLTKLSHTTPILSHLLCYQLLVISQKPIFWVLNIIRRLDC